MRPRLDRDTADALGAWPATLEVRRPAPVGRLCAVFPPEVADRHHTLDDTATLVGRDPGPRGFTIDERTVSRHHLAVAWDEGAGCHAVTDLGSRNGSRVDGARVECAPRPLDDGAVLRIGDVLLVYERGAPAASSAAGGVSRDAVPGDSGVMHHFRERLARAAFDRSPVLVIGETGTGKERIAAEIHRLSGRRGPFVPVNCATLNRTLVESQLFGHLRGAFTGASAPHAGLFRAAEGGTLFLDEIGELPLDLQPKLLRAIEQREVQPIGGVAPLRVDVRVVAATNRELAAAATLDGDGTFRADLYARLAIWELRVPPLRGRRGDLFGWIARLHRRLAQERWSDAAARGQHRAEADGTSTTALPLFDADAAEILLRHDWPLNLRGIERLVHELGVASPQPGAPRLIGSAELPDCLTAARRSSTRRIDVPTVLAPADGPEPRRWDLAAPLATGPGTGSARPPVPSREELAAVFTRFHGSVRATAKHFGRDRRQIYRWLHSHALHDHRLDADRSREDQR